MLDRQSKTKLGLVLRSIRTAQEKSVKDVAFDLEVTSRYVTQIENGNKTISYEMLKLFAKHFGIPASKIVEIEELSKKQDLSYEDILLLCVEYECGKNKNNNLEDGLLK